MTSSRIVWFLGIFILTLPILLVAIKGDREFTSGVVLVGVGVAAALGVFTALLWGKGPN